MLEILKFIFSSFWVWLGTTIILAMIASILGEILAIMFGKFKD